MGSMPVSFPNVLIGIYIIFLMYPESHSSCDILCVLGGPPAGAEGGPYHPGVHSSKQYWQRRIGTPDILCKP